MVKACYFAGHSRIYNQSEIYEKLLCAIKNLIENEGIEEFRVGNYGEFDRISARAVREIKKSYPSVKLILMLPYMTVEIAKNKNYFENNFDEIVIANIPANTPYTARIIKCNKQAIDFSQFLICHIEHTWGGAAKTLEYAKKNNLKIIEL